MSDLLSILNEELKDKYVLQRELGRGGMATVFYAEDVKHGRGVAIKVLHPDVAASMGQDRFLREIEIAAKLQHPHILGLYDSGAAGNHFYYVMPFVEGESLRDRLDREKQLGQEDVLKITAQVASALGYAHARGVVHRDIKPENIMLSGDTAIVADFGIARTEGGGHSLTQTGTIIGTPTYMSPEQGTGSPDIDGRTDQYSLACVVYEMLVGAPPFTGPTVQAVIARHSMDLVSPPSIVRESIPDTMETALLKALSKTPADRYPTVVMFAEALGRPSNITASQRRRTMGGMPAEGARRAPPWKLIAGAAGGVAVLAIAFILFRGRGGRSIGGTLEGPDPRKIAVLYFTDRSSGKSLGYVADGMTEALIHELATVQTLKVISPNGVAPYRGTTVRQDSIAKALSVGTIVSGAVDQIGDSLLLSVSMSNAVNGNELGSARLVAPKGNVLALQDTLAKEVARVLRPQLGQEVEQVVSRAGTGNKEAWDLVEQAAGFDRQVEPLLASNDTAAAARALANADSVLAKASHLDARWTTPVIERGWIAWHQRHVKGMQAADSWTKQGIDFADQALKIGPDSAALHLRGTMRYVRYLLNLDPGPLKNSDQLLAAAGQDLTAGGEDLANPRRAEALTLLAHLEARISEGAQAKVFASQAYDADPYLSDANETVWMLYATSLDLGDRTESSRWCQEGSRRFPNDSYFTECQISLTALKGGPKPDIPKLWKLLDQNVQQYQPADRDFRRYRGSLLVAMGIANAGLKDSARNVAMRARAGWNNDPAGDLFYIEMFLRNLLGDRSEALDLLARYLAKNPQERPNVAKDRTWWLDGLRDDPKFKALVGSR
ncbi:MAG TPA: serine/threonine-protein kinase [Gemmatimonadales bacterium]|nr:serine/threonine-protein kinase [Gemmatimonadales bacterium]